MNWSKVSKDLRFRIKKEPEKNNSGEFIVQLEIYIATGENEFEFFPVTFDGKNYAKGFLYNITKDKFSLGEMSLKNLCKRELSGNGGFFINWDFSPCTVSSAEKKCEEIKKTMEWRKNKNESISDKSHSRSR